MVKAIIKQTIIVLTVLGILAGLYILYQVYSPEIEYRIDKPDEKAVIRQIEEQEEYTENKLVTPSTEVDMIIGTNKSNLDNGGWIQRFDSNDLPNLIAIHRFGWSTLSPEQKIRQTLYHVDKLQDDDIVYIIWEGEKYEYEVDSIIDGDNNPSLSGKIIIYTCKFMSTNQRIFVVLKNYNI
jgi:hypothetical protein